MQAVSEGYYGLLGAARRQNAGLPHACRVRGRSSRVFPDGTGDTPGRYTASRA
ncbi:hypothetical protein ASZ90_010819 [hydrocarbon metagenome]|uniref:Uncharacterized protein n=1 Tax=hydrocarbon metagenome TaxID=938273 RepID=A0A0W8FEY2_9ZZZZ